MKRLIRSPHFLPILTISIIVLVVYLLTMPPGLTWEHWGYDAGDLISCVYTFGIPHPSGTPLYILVGQVFRFLPFFSVPAAKFNFMSITFGWLTLVVTYLTCFKLTRSRYASLGATFFLAFTPLFWGQSIVAEVLTLNSFLISLVVYFLVCWESSSVERLGIGSPGPIEDKYLYWALFFLGLVLTNHLSGITIAPAVLFLIWTVDSGVFLARRRMIRSILSLLLGLLPFLYLPIRAAMRPPLNWGDPSNLSRFLAHVSGREYQGMLFFKSQGLVLDNAFGFLAALWKNFNPIGFLLGVLGLVFGRKDRIRDFLIFASLFQLIFILNWNVVNFEVYYLPVFAISTLFLSIGLVEVQKHAREMRAVVERTYQRLFAKITFWGRGWRVSFGDLAFFIFSTLLLFFAILNLPLSFRDVDLSWERTAENYGRGTFAVLEPNAIVLTEGDNYGLGLTYFKYVVFPERTDVAVLHEGLFYKLAWMLEQARRNYPNLKFPRKEVTFEEDEALKALLDFIELNRKDHPIYLAVGEPPPKPEFAQRSVFADTYVIQSVGPVFKVMGRK